MSKERESRNEIRTPMRMNLSAERAMAIPGMAQKLAPMAGGQEPGTECRDTFHQNVCVEGEVTTEVNARCEARVFCLGGGIGQGCVGVVEPDNTCSFKFFENLCVEVDVIIDATAHCEITGIVCTPPEEGPCFPTTTTTTTTTPPNG